ncbi:TPA: hypothetical protein ACS784_003742, partial [Providencia alcalifaciens]
KKNHNTKFFSITMDDVMDEVFNSEDYTIINPKPTEFDIYLYQRERFFGLLKLCEIKLLENLTQK